MKRSLIRFTFLIPALSVLAIACAGVRPSNLGVKDGRLSPCPASPNCVSSQSSDKAHLIEPLPFSGTVAKAQEDLKGIILGGKRSRVVTETDTYIHTEFTSAIFRFVDDVEFLIDEKSNLIHVRSASRLGHSDLGVNRKRIEAIRALWNERVR